MAAARIDIRIEGSRFITMIILSYLQAGPGEPGQMG
jgi:hypothetical protein